MDSASRLDLKESYRKETTPDTQKHQSGKVKGNSTLTNESQEKQHPAKEVASKLTSSTDRQLPSDMFENDVTQTRVMSPLGSSRLSQQQQQAFSNSFSSRPITPAPNSANGLRYSTQQRLNGGDKRNTTRSIRWGAEDSQQKRMSPRNEPHEGGAKHIVDKRVGCKNAFAEEDIGIDGGVRLDIDDGIGDDPLLSFRPLSSSVMGSRRVKVTPVTSLYDLEGDSTNFPNHASKAESILLDEKQKQKNELPENDNDSNANDKREKLYQRGGGQERTAEESLLKEEGKKNADRSRVATQLLPLLDLSSCSKSSTISPPSSPPQTTFATTVSSLTKATITPTKEGEGGATISSATSSLTLPALSFPVGGSCVVSGHVSSQPTSHCAPLSMSGARCTPPLFPPPSSSSSSSRQSFREKMMSSQARVSYEQRRALTVSTPTPRNTPKPESSRGTAEKDTVSLYSPGSTTTQNTYKNGGSYCYYGVQKQQPGTRIVVSSCSFSASAAASPRCSPRAIDDNTETTSRQILQSTSTQAAGPILLAPLTHLSSCSPPSNREQQKSEVPLDEQSKSRKQKKREKSPETKATTNRLLLLDRKDTVPFRGLLGKTSKPTNNDNEEGGLSGEEDRCGKPSVAKKSTACDKQAGIEYDDKKEAFDEAKREDEKEEREEDHVSRSDDRRDTSDESRNTSEDGHSEDNEEGRISDSGSSSSSSSSMSDGYDTTADLRQIEQDADRYAATSNNKFRTLRETPPECDLHGDASQRSKVIVNSSEVVVSSTATINEKGTEGGGRRIGEMGVGRGKGGVAVLPSLKATMAKIVDEKLRRGSGTCRKSKEAITSDDTRRNILNHPATTTTTAALFDADAGTAAVGGGFFGRPASSFAANGNALSPLISPASRGKYTHPTVLMAPRRTSSLSYSSPPLSIPVLMSVFIRSATPNSSVIRGTKMDLTKGNKKSSMSSKLMSPRKKEEEESSGLPNQRGAKIGMLLPTNPAAAANISSDVNGNSNLTANPSSLSHSLPAISSYPASSHPLFAPLATAPTGPYPKPAFDLSGGPPQQQFLAYQHVVDSVVSPLGGDRGARTPTPHGQVCKDTSNKKGREKAHLQRARSTSPLPVTDAKRKEKEKVDRADSPLCPSSSRRNSSTTSLRETPSSPSASRSQSKHGTRDLVSDEVSIALSALNAKPICREEIISMRNLLYPHGRVQAPNSLTDLLKCIDLSWVTDLIAAKKKLSAKRGNDFHTCRITSQRVIEAGGADKKGEEDQNSNVDSTLKDAETAAASTKNLLTLDTKLLSADNTHYGGPGIVDFAHTLINSPRSCWVLVRNGQSPYHLLERPASFYALRSEAVEPEVIASRKRMSDRVRVAVLKELQRQYKQICGITGDGGDADADASTSSSSSRLGEKSGNEEVCGTTKTKRCHFPTVISAVAAILGREEMEIAGEKQRGEEEEAAHRLAHRKRNPSRKFKCSANVEEDKLLHPSRRSHSGTELLDKKGSNEVKQFPATAEVDEAKALEAVKVTAERRRRMYDRVVAMREEAARKALKTHTEAQQREERRRQELAQRAAVNEQVIKSKQLRSERLTAEAHRKIIEEYKRLEARQAERAEKMRQLQNRLLSERKNHSQQEMARLQRTREQLASLEEEKRRRFEASQALKEAQQERKEQLTAEKAEQLKEKRKIQDEKRLIAREIAAEKAKENAERAERRLQEASARYEQCRNELEEQLAERRLRSLKRQRHVEETATKKSELMERKREALKELEAAEKAAFEANEAHLRTKRRDEQEFRQFSKTQRTVQTESKRRQELFDKLVEATVTSEKFDVFEEEQAKREAAVVSIRSLRSKVRLAHEAMETAELERLIQIEKEKDREAYLLRNPKYDPSL